MPDDDAGHAVVGQAGEDVADQVGGRSLRTPWRSDDLETGPYFVHARAVQHHHVVGPLLGEQGAGVHRAGVERIVVAGQQVHGHLDATHGLQRLADDARCEVVVLEHVARDDDELGAHLLGDRPHGGDDVTAGSRITRLRLVVQEVAGHAELPVGGMQESHPIAPLVWS